MIALLATGVAVQTVGTAGSIPPVERSGTVLVLAGAVGYGYLLVGAFAAR